MGTNDRLINKTFRGILLVNTVSLVSAIICVMIDAIVVGQFLGSKAVAAIGLISPVVMLCNIVGTLFGPGVGVVCTRYMGMARPDRVNQAFSLVIVVMLVLSLMISGGLFFTASLLADTLGGKTGDQEITLMIEKYIKGYCIGIPFTNISMCMAGLMMLDNDRGRSVGCTFAILIGDVAADLINVVVLKGGMFGMAFASSVSGILGFLVVITHFFKKDRILSFTVKDMQFSDLKEVVLCGIPNSLASGCMSLRNIIFNGLLLSVGTTASISAMSVANSFYSLIFALTLALLVSTSTMISLYYGEENRKGIEASFKMSLKAVTVILGAITAIVLIFSDLVTGLFLKSNDPDELGQAALFIRSMMIETFIMGISYTFGGVQQAIRNNGIAYLVVSLREGILPIACAAAVGSVFGVKGVAAGIIISGAFTFISCIIIPSLKLKRPIRRLDDMLLLDKDFGSAPEDVFEASLNDIEGVMEASRGVMEFCSKRETARRTAVMTSLFIEEAVGNIVRHGFAEGKSGNIDLRVISSKEKLVIRIRDDGKPFDPVDWYNRNHPEDPASGVGIRAIVGLADDVRCIPSMGLNNLMITIDRERKERPL